LGYEINDNILVVTGDLIEFMDMTFEVELSKLLDSESSELTLDLMQVGTIVSQYIGQIAACSATAQESNRTLRVIASGQVGKVLTSAGLDQMLQLDIY
jgi:anti-anti-sigma regulatory factor